MYVCSTGVYAYIHACKHMHTYIFTYTLTRMYECMPTYTHTHIHTYTHTHIHTVSKGSHGTTSSRLAVDNISKARRYRSPRGFWYTPTLAPSCTLTPLHTHICFQRSTLDLLKHLCAYENIKGLLTLSLRSAPDHRKLFIGMLTYAAREEDVHALRRGTGSSFYICH
jgi:hypothetical protein